MAAKVIEQKLKPCDVIWDLTSLDSKCRNYITDNRPVLIKGAAKDWAALKKWSFNFFKESSIGNTKVKVSLDGKESGNKCIQTLREFICKIQAEEPRVSSSGSNDSNIPEFPPYLRAWYFADDSEELLQDFPAFPTFFPDKFKKLDSEFQPPFTWLFIGPKGAFSPLHRDIWFTCAWMAQIEGRKRFIFFPPSDLKHIYRKV